MEDLKIVNADNLLYTSLDEVEFIIEDILPIGLHIFCGAPKVGKSWLMLDICIRVSKGEEIWNLKTNKCDVLYLALEDTYQRLQKRLFKLTDDIGSNFHISIESNKIANGLISQLEQTLQKYPNTKLIVIDTLQKVRKQNNDINYSNDYTDISLLKQLILIDEPELHLHPRLQEKFVDFILEISKDSQVILTTHSPLLIKQLAYNENVKNIVLKKDKDVKEFDERKLSYISSNETNYLAFDLPSEEYHNELYESLMEKYSTSNGIKRFDNEFFIQQKKEDKIYPWEKQPNQVSIHTFIRNQIHHRKDNRCC